MGGAHLGVHYLEMRRWALKRENTVLVSELSINSRIVRAQLDIQESCGTEFGLYDTALSVGSRHDAGKLHYAHANVIH